MLDYSWLKAKIEKIGVRMDLLENERVLDNNWH